MTFEEQLLAKVAAARGRHPALADEDRRRRAWLGNRTLPSLALLWPLLVIARHAGEDRLDAALAATGVYLFATALVRGRELRHELRSGHDVAAFAALPASDEFLAERAFRRTAQSSLATLLPVLVAGWLSLPAGSAAWQWATLAAAGVLACCVVVALATACAVSPALGRWAWLGFALHLAVVVTAYFPLGLPKELPAAAWFPIGLSPGGWIAQILRHALGQSDPRGLVWLVPAVAAAAVLPALYSRLARAHRVAEVVFVGQGAHFARFEGESLDDMVTTPAEEEAEGESLAGEESDAPEAPGTQARAAPPATREQVAALLDVDAHHDSPFLDRAIRALLTGREVVVAAWLMGRKPRWSGEWGAIQVACGVTVVGSLVVLPGLVPFVALAAPLVLAVALFTWSGFELRRSGGQVSPLHAVYPLGYAEAARVILKVNAARLVASFPALFAAGSVAWASAGEAPLDACLLAVKLWSMLLVAQPLVVVGAFMGGANDQLGLRTVVAVPFVIAGALAWLMSGVLCIVERGAGGWLAFSIFAAIPMAVLLIYGWIYNRRHVDLLRTPR
jgi:hypothetical protein